MTTAVHVSRAFTRVSSVTCILQFAVVLFSMLFSTLPVSILGTRFAMAIQPFWEPNQYSASDITTALYDTDHRVYWLKFP